MTTLLLRTHIGARPPKPPLVVKLSRIIQRGQPLDDDNLRSALKAIRDAVAAYLGVDDGSPEVRYEYSQSPPVFTTWGVHVEFMTLQTLRTSPLLVPSRRGSEAAGARTKRAV